MNNICLTYAGAGAGKTTNMINKIESAIIDLKDYKFLATITYTNSATNDIKLKLAKRIKIPDNVFIGTIHSFMIRFFIEPFMKSNGRILYVNKISEKSLDWIDSWAKEKNIPNDKKIGILNKKKKELLDKCKEKGIISFDKLVELAKQYSENKNIIKIVSNRLQFLFIDEYQDTRSWQHKMFLNIAKQKKTLIYSVGDPNQYIYSFTYGQSQIGEKKPKKLPIEELKKISEKSKNFNIIYENHRSTKEIICFANKFNYDFGQNYENRESYKKIKFINNNDPKEIIIKFNSLKEILKLKDKSLILSKEWKIYEDLKNYYNSIVKIDKEIIENVFAEIEKCIFSVSGYNRKDFFENNEFDNFNLRVFAIKLWNKIKNTKNILTKDYLLKEYKECYGNVMNQQENNIEYQELDINNFFSDKTDCIFSTIHKSKGLEAESVLVIAKTRNQLFKWLNATKENMKSSDDDFRLGYVAFTRAKKLLILSCFEKLNKNELQTIEDMKIKII